MKKRLLAAVLCLAMLITCVPSFAFQAQASELPVITCNGSAQSAVSFPRNERITLTAEGGSWYQWQIKVNDSLWVNISGETGETLDVSYAMIANLCQGDTAYLRVAADGERFSDPVAVTAGEAVIKEAATPAAASYVVQAAPQAVVSDSSTDSSTGSSANSEAVAQAQAALAAAEAAANEAAEIAAAAEEDASAKQAAYYEAQDKADAAKQAMEVSAVTTEIPAETSAEEVDENGNPVVIKPAETVVTYDPELQAAYAAAQAEADAAWQVYSAAALTLADAEANLQAAQDAVEAAAAELEAIQNQPTGENSGRANFALAREGEGTTTYNVVIYYVFQDGSTAAQPYIANLAAGTNHSATVNHPTVQGYLPYVGESAETSDKIELNITNIQADVTYTVTYKPTNVNYTVIHYQQNLNDDYYTEKDRETKQGLTNSTVGTNSDGSTFKLEKEYEGFYALLYEKPTIAADGSTVVEIYYDRYYYLMNFDLDGGYGVEPIYARYGTPVSVGTPTKAGYSFSGWTLDGVSATIPATMPAENNTYTAQWSTSDSSYTVVYWLENADDEYYSTFGQITVPATTGTIVNGETYRNYSSYITTDANFQAVEPFIAFEKADENVTVAGDKSTTVNVYYTRNEYTLKFYYAISSRTSQTSTNYTYYVIGGSSYAFGASGDSTTNSIDNLTKYYMDGGSWVSHRGQVDEIPQLNSDGLGRNYTTGYDTATKTVQSGWWSTTYYYNYYYISFTAKYGADISALWPYNVFQSVTRTDKDNTNGYNGTEAYVSAWNGEHHVYYSQHNGNQTIKGNYNQLDTQLLWDNAQFKAYADSNNTVDFLCFWENGANIEWSVPELYVHRIWVPVLEGQDTAGLTTKTKNGVTYYLWDSRDTVDDSDVDHQTAPAINGLTYLGDSYKEWTKLSTSEFDNTLYSEAYIVDFFYSRNQYNLTFMNGGLEDKTEQVYFEADISEKGYTPDLPTDVFEEGGYKFDGWYTSAAFEEGTKFDFDEQIMPANDLVLYAHWVLVTHTVEFYLDQSAMQAGTKLVTHSDITVPHGSKVETVPTDPSNGSYTFVGWFYMDGNTEKAFDFANMPVTKDMKVYGKWSSNVLKQYFIYYKYKDAEGNEIEIAAPTTGSGLAGVTKTFEAKGGADLYADYQEGYFPVTKSHSMTLDINATEENNTNAYTFWYVQKDAVPYTVYYVTESQNANNTLTPVTINGVTYYMVAETKTVSDNRKAVVTETFVPVNGMMPDAYQKRLVVSVDENGNPDTAHNVIIFFYTEDTTHAYYKITHYTENLGTDTQGNPTWTEYASSQAVGDIGSPYEGEPMTIPGFTYSTEVTGDQYKGVLTGNGLELKLYYTRNSYPYQVRYLEQGTGDTLATPKNGTGKYGQVISESAIDIDNYTAVDPTSQTLNIKIETPNDQGQIVAALNVITFYYTENEATINYQVVGPTGCGTVSPTSETLKVLTGTAQGSTATASSNTYKFVGWYSDEACTNLLTTEAKYTPTKADGAAWVNGTTYYAKFEYNLTTLTITKSGALNENDGFIFDVTGNGESYTVSVKGNGSVTIAGVTVGATYTITERSDWAWRYTVPIAQPITLVADGANNTVTVANSAGKSYLLDGSAYAQNISKPSSADE